MFNMAYLPANVPANEMLWWMEYLPIQHEFGHYHICPYSGKDIARYIKIICKELQQINRDRAFYILNLYSDWVVNHFLSKRFPTDFIKALKYWFVWQDVLTQKNQLGHSHTWNIFVRVHEFDWHESLSSIAMTPDEEAAALAIHREFQSLNNEDVILANITKILKPFIDDDLREDQPVAKLGVFIFDYDAMENDPDAKQMQAAAASMSAAQQNNATPNHSDPTAVPPSPLSASGQAVKMKVVQFKGKIVPFDVLETGGDPFDEKYPSMVGDANPDTEMDDILDEIAQQISGSAGGRGKGIGIDPVKLVKEFGFASDTESAIRMLFRSRAKGLLRYDEMTDTKTGEARDTIRTWEWSDPVHRWDINKSLNANPIFPYPPSALQWTNRTGNIGHTKRGYRDLMLVIDSSGSMLGLSGKAHPKTPTDYAVLASFAILYAAVEKNVQFSIINFSSGLDIMAMPWVKPTYQNIISAEMLLMHFFSMGTIIPTAHIQKLLAKKQHCLVIIVSDNELGNPDETVALIEEYAHEHVFMLFHIGKTDRDNKFVQHATSAGGFLIPVRKFEDLPGLVLNHARGFYK